MPAAPANQPLNVWRDPSFWGLNIAQFLGALNDNLFKELVLILCAHAGHAAGHDLQGPATVIFTAPFILLSGTAGYLADRFPKPRIIELCKLAEIGITLLGMFAFFTGQLTWLLVVLGLMGVHSAFFGPPKYGVLPELFRRQTLPMVNGTVLMATFLAIIFGLTAAGAVSEFFQDRLWLGSAVCLGVAVAGWLASRMIRPLPPAEPDLAHSRPPLLMTTTTWQSIRSQPELFRVLGASSAFWMIGGMVYPPAINDLGLHQLGLTDLGTGLLAASTGLGIAVGCIVAGLASRQTIRGSVVRFGAWGVVAMLALLAIPGGRIPAADPGGPARILVAIGVTGSGLALAGLGFCAGLYSVPLQVYLQAMAPTEQKGRIVAAMNLFNWCGILVGGAMFWLASTVSRQLQLPPQAVFGLAAILFLPVPLVFRPPTVSLGLDQPTTDSSTAADK